MYISIAYLYDELQNITSKKHPRFLAIYQQLGSLAVTCRTCNPEVTQRRRFDAAPGHCRVTTLGKLFTHTVNKQYNLVPVKGR